MSDQKLTVLFCPLDYHGHINACHGIAEILRDRGHRVVFAIDIAFEGKLAIHGFEEETLSAPLSVIGYKDEIKVDLTTDYVLQMMDLFEMGTLTLTKEFIVLGFENMFKFFKAKDSQYKNIIARVKPDLILIDSYIGSPTLTDSNIPWVWLYSAAPLMALNNEGLPPPWSGFPTNGDRNQWKEYRDKFEPLFANLHKMIAQWYEERHSQQIKLTDSPLIIHPLSEHLNIYMSPKELDYGVSSEKWKRVDCFVRTIEQRFEIPECLKQRSGKLVFLSMGSIGCSHLDLMKRLVQILSKSEHRFIVAMGPIHKMYELANNMWGQPFVPQTAILPLVDLVITHGGNNTVTETFFFGKPSLVLPLFGDQFDNAQRIQETGLGLRLDPFKCTESQLLAAVDQLVNDKQLIDRMDSIGHRIRNNSDKQIIADIIENIVKK